MRALLLLLLLCAAFAEDEAVPSDASTERLTSLLEKGSATEKRRAMQVLADRKEKEGLASLLKIAEAADTDLLTRHMAVSCLHTYRDRSAIPLLLKLLRPDIEPDITFREHVADTLGMWTHQCMPLLSYDPAKDPPEGKKLEESSINAWWTWWLEDREKDEAAWIDRGLTRAIDLLRSPDDTMRGYAIYHLKTQTDLDFDYNPQGEPAAREASVQRWEKWWLENRKRLHRDPKTDRLVTGE